jgi:hypothetical protein
MQTFATSKYTITAWDQKDKSVELMFDVDVKDLAKLEAGVKWFSERSTDGWRGAEATDAVGFLSPIDPIQRFSC